MDMSRSVPDLSVSMSVSSSPVTLYWALEEFVFSVTDALTSFEPRLLGFRRFVKFIFCNQYRSAKLAPAA